MIGKSETVRGIVYGFVLAAIFGLFYLLSCCGLWLWVAATSPTGGDDTGIGILIISVPSAALLTGIVLALLRWKYLHDNRRALKHLAEENSAPK